ncbi:MAG TPA: hypothetical protein VGK89_12875 [Candidatus Eisenbacteria bacterium]|jgi:hypothetical protein
MKRRVIFRPRLRDDRPPWQRWAAFVVGLLLLLLAPLIAHAQGVDTLQLVWTAPGDDGDVGTATGYEVRVSTSPITLGTWGAANVVAPAPAPLASGTRQAFTVRGLSTDTTYYFAIRSVDDAGNWSDLSNVLAWDWVADTSPPGAPAGVAGVKVGADVRVTWSAGPEPDLNGYTVYRATDASGPFTRVSGTLITGAQYLDAAVPAGADAVWYQVTASDLSGNEGAPSAPAKVALVTPPAPWTLSPGYPNPSRTGESVCIPIVVPAGGAGDAAVDIVDGGGHRVRHIALSSAVSCGAGGVVWDGANEAGRAAAPGVYRAWLIAGDSRESVRLVRVP